MKKILVALTVVACMGSFTFAQDKKAKPTQAAVAKPATPAKAVAPAHATPQLKKDGTPDMRTKENKANAAAAKTTGPLKKDGGADMRYKANKAAAKKKA